MAKKRSVASAPASKRTAQAQQPVQPRWRQILLIVSVVPMLVGVILFVASWFDAIWIGNATTQTVTGGVLACLGFALSNTLQAKWPLAGGWALLGVAVWLLVAPPLLPLRWLGAVAGIAGGALVLLAFVQRYRQVRPTV